MLTNNLAGKIFKSLPWPINLCLALMGTEKDIENPDSFIDNLVPDYEACIEKMIRTLPNPEYQEIFLARYREKKTLQQIADEFGKSPERIRQIIARERYRLRHPSRIKYLKYGIKGVEAIERAAKEAEKNKSLKEQNVWEYIDTVFTFRACNGLSRAGYRTIADTLSLTEEDIRLLPNVGAKTAENILQAQEHFKNLLEIEAH